MGTESLGKQVKTGRLRKQMTQRELADAAEVSMPYISKIEADKETPTDEKLIRIAQILGLNSDDLIVAAGRIPADAMAGLSADPTRALEFLRKLHK